MELTKKHKQFDYIQYYRGIELSVLCVTTSKKKFADMVGTSTHHITNYSLAYEPRDEQCKANPDVLFARMGMGGEGTYVFDRDMILPLDEYKKLIDKHRKTYENYRDYLKKTGQE